ARRLPRGYRTAANDPYIEVELRFQNPWEDPESGLYYNYRRYYDPDTGQYLSPDPIGLRGGLRPHGYVHNPVGWVDPWGLAGCPQEVNVPNRSFKPGEDLVHFEKHGPEIAKTLGYENYSLTQYVADANTVVKNGTFVPELNAYVSI